MQNTKHKSKHCTKTCSDHSVRFGLLGSRKSFTLIELLVTSAIIMIMLGITIAYSQRGEGINKVNRAMERLAFDIRRVANLSTQTQEISEKKICG